MNSGDTGSVGETVAVPSGNAGVKLDDGGIGVDGTCVEVDASAVKLSETLGNGDGSCLMGVCGKMPSPLCALASSTGR